MKTTPPKKPSLSKTKSVKKNTISEKHTSNKKPTHRTTVAESKNVAKQTRIEDLLLDRIEDNTVKQITKKSQQPKLKAVSNPRKKLNSSKTDAVDRPNLETIDVVTKTKVQIKKNNPTRKRSLSSAKKINTKIATTAVTKKTAKAKLKDNKVASSTYIDDIKKIKQIRNLLKNSDLQSKDVFKEFKNAVALMKTIISQLNDFNAEIGDCIKRKLDE